MLTEENKNFFMAHVLSLVNYVAAAITPKDLLAHPLHVQPCRLSAPSHQREPRSRPPKVIGRSSKGDLGDDKTSLTLPMYPFP